MARYGFWSHYTYTPVHEKQAKAKRSQSRLAKTHGTLQPVVVSGRALARSWWGQAWNENLERYSDYENRLPRGRTYLRGGMVLHLAVEPGKVSALVQGSRPQPYEVTIKVSALNAATWAKARTACSGQLESLQALLSGQFPDGLKELFMVKGGGLFPSPSEIALDCTCPDWASMCKHVAAVLYGVGTRLDADPKLFFTLRQVSVDDLVAKALQGTSEALLDKAGKAAAHALETADLGNVFGIDLDESPATVSPAADKAAQAPATAPTKRGRGRPAKPIQPVAAAKPTQRGAKAADSAVSTSGGAQGRRKVPATQKVTPAARRGGAETEAAKQRLRQARLRKALLGAVQALNTERPAGALPAPPSGSAVPRHPVLRSGARSSRTPASSTDLPPMLVTLLKALRGKRSGLAIPDLVQATGFSETQARNTVARAQARGLVVSLRRGVYALA
jgi:uncharacterized Zn finger protein